MEGSLDTTRNNEDSPIMFLCGENLAEIMTMREYGRLVDEGIITVGDFPVNSAKPDIGVKARGEA